MESVSSLVLGLFLLHLAAAGKEPSEQYYKEMKCTPVIEAGETEPSRYDCNHLNNMAEDKCYFNGRFYSDGEKLPDGDVGNNCLIYCTCRVDSERKSAFFSCVNIECPEHFGRYADENCYLQYSSDKCCSTSQNCESEGATCEYDGEKYREGQKFFPSNRKCTTCICSKDYNGTLDGPWCNTLSCNMFLHYGESIRQGCVPTYYNPDDCCPIPVWRCPGEEPVKVLGNPIASPKSEDHMCKFGKVKLGVGQHLESDPNNECVRCSCQVPPHVTCIMDRACYEGASRSLI